MNLFLARGGGGGRTLGTKNKQIYESTSLRALLYIDKKLVLEVVFTLLHPNILLCHREIETFLFKLYLYKNYCFLNNKPKSKKKFKNQLIEI